MKKDIQFVIGDKVYFKCWKRPYTRPKDYKFYTGEVVSEDADSLTVKIKSLWFFIKKRFNKWHIYNIVKI